jgi:hypothetical protein
MTQLEKLYQSIQNLKELGVQLPDKLIDETNRVEEEIIKNDIIPALAETISPVITQIQREIILVVEYIPDEPLSVRLTRKRSMTIPAEQDIAYEKNKTSQKSSTVTISPHTKSSKTVLCVKFPNGKTISHRFAYQTFLDTLKNIGVEKITPLNIVVRGIALISEARDDFYTQHEISKDIFVVTQTSTKEKKEQLDYISKKLKLGLKVDII